VIDDELSCTEEFTGSFGVAESELDAAARIKKVEINIDFKIPPEMISSYTV
jgi:hypothetical protein